MKEIECERVKEVSLLWEFGNKWAKRVGEEGESLNDENKVGWELNQCLDESFVEPVHFQFNVHQM